MKLKPPKWWYQEQGAMATALKPVSRIYGRIAEKKASQAAPYLSRLPVICIGNFTVGGSGKTPTAIAVAKILKLAGERPAFLTRGYGGKEEGPLRVTEGMDAARVGDEPLLLAEHAPTIVSADREKGAKLIETMDATVIVMDDGFQNSSIGKDLSLICVDAKTGIGNAMVLPSGPLRAPLEPQIRMADALIVVGEGSKANDLIDRFTEAGKLVLKAEIGFRQDTRWLGVLPVIGFAGIAQPDRFFRTLRDAGARLTDKKVFPDHHRFTDKQAQALLDEADARNCMLVTTEKDWVRLSDDRETPQGELRFRSRPLPIEIRIGDEAALGDLMTNAINRKRGDVPKG